MQRRPHAAVFALALALAVVVVAAVAGCSGGGAASAPTAPAGASSGAATGGGTTINEQDFAFGPNTLTVKVGDTVTFTNSDSVAHNVKIDGQVLGAQNLGQSKTWKATTGGSFPFSCTLHPSMTGQITVQ